MGEQAESERRLRERSRAAGRVVVLEAELGKMRGAQDALKRRLTEQVAAHEAQNVHRCRELSALRKAADISARRMLALEAENKLQRMLLKVSALGCMWVHCPWSTLEDRMMMIGSMAMANLA